MAFRCDLRSDTVSTPGAAMRIAMSRAPVGDDVFGEDPSVNTLERIAAELLGKEAAVFVPSGTMANGVAIRSMASPGDEVICGSASHVFNFEGAQFALNGGIQLHPLPELPSGTPDPETISFLLGGKADIHQAPRVLVALENTHNMLGGVICSEGSVAEIADLAESAGVSLYLDGARFWHSAPRDELRSLASRFTMLSVCFSKALGCPVGSLTAGPGELVQKARWYRKRMGGGMRQAGILAGACIWALEHNLPRLGETHEMLQTLLEAVERSPGLSCEAGAFPTNILMADVIEGTAEQAVAALGARGVGVLALGRGKIRMVTHLSLKAGDLRHGARVIESYGG